MAWLFHPRAGFRGTDYRRQIPFRNIPNRATRRAGSTFLSVSSITLSTTSLSLPLEQTYTVCSARPYVGKITPLEKQYIHSSKAENTHSSASSGDAG